MTVIDPSGVRAAYTIAKASIANAIDHADTALAASGWFRTGPTTAARMEALDGVLLGIRQARTAVSSLDDDAYRVGALRKNLELAERSALGHQHHLSSGGRVPAIRLDRELRAAWTNAHQGAVRHLHDESAPRVNEILVGVRNQLDAVDDVRRSDVVIDEAVRGAIGRGAVAS